MLSSEKEDGNKIGSESEGACKKNSAPTNASGSAEAISKKTVYSPSHKGEIAGAILIPQLTPWENPEIEKRIQIKKANIFLHKMIK